MSPRFMRFLVVAVFLVVTVRTIFAEPTLEDLREKGLALYQGGRYVEAVSAFSDALELTTDPSQHDELEKFLARSLGAHGVRLLEAGENRRAEAAFRRALEYHRDFYAYFGLGFLHLSRLEDVEAQRRLREAALLEPDYQQIYRLQGILEYRRGNLDAAIKAMEKAVELEPQDEEAARVAKRWRTEERVARRFVEHRRGSMVLRADPEISEDDVARVLASLERILAELRAVFLLQERRPLVAVLLRERTFAETTGSHAWVGGLYDGQLKVPFASGEPRALEELEATLRHEVTHFLIQSVSPECPNWLNEGIAQYFEGRHDPRSMRERLRRDSGRRLAWRDVPARLWEVVDVEEARWTYIQALGFVQFLVREHHAFRLLLLLESMARLGSVAEAFQHTYGESLEALEQRWWDDVLRVDGESVEASGAR